MSRKDLLLSAAAVATAIVVMAASLYAANAQTPPHPPQPSPPPWAGAQPVAPAKPAAPQPASAPAPAAEVAAPLFTLASVVAPGEKPTSGDIMNVSRTFDAWIMQCDFRLSTNRRICGVQQTLSNPDGSLYWRVSLDAAMKPILVLAIPAAADLDAGLTLTLGSVERILKRDQFRCANNICIAGVPFDAPLSAAIASQPIVPITYKTLAAAKSEAKTVRLEAPLNGFSAALDAIAKDPLGREIASKVAATTAAASQKPAKKTPKP